MAMFDDFLMVFDGFSQGCSTLGPMFTPWAVLDVRGFEKAGRHRGWQRLARNGRSNLSNALLPGAVMRRLSHPQNGGKQVNVKKTRFQIYATFLYTGLKI